MLLPSAAWHRAPVPFVQAQRRASPSPVLALLPPRQLRMAVLMKFQKSARCHRRADPHRLRDHSHGAALAASPAGAGSFPRAVVGGWERKVVEAAWPVSQQTVENICIYYVNMYPTYPSHSLGPFCRSGNGVCLEWGWVYVSQLPLGPELQGRHLRVLWSLASRVPGDA